MGALRLGTLASNALCLARQVMHHGLSSLASDAFMSRKASNASQPVSSLASDALCLARQVMHYNLSSLASDALHMHHELGKAYSVVMCCQCVSISESGTGALSG